MKQHAEMSLFVKHVADKQQFPVSFLTLHSARHSQSRSRHFGGIPEEKKTRPDHVTRNELAARDNEAYGQFKSPQTGVLYSPFCIIKITGRGNFVIGRFDSRARKRIIRLRVACVQSPPPPQTPLFRFVLFFFSFSEGRGWLYTGYLERIIQRQTVRQNWQIKSGELFIQN